MNLTLPLEPGLFLTDSSPGMRAYPVTAFVPHDPRPPQSNQSLLSANQSADLSVSFHPVGRPIWQVLLIAILCGSLSLLTIIGNILVLLSFKLNRQLKTVSNYYLLSLAFADLIIGVLSMNLYTTYIIMGHWALGPWACDLWLAIDYVASNASVMNLLVISFDRYFSITRPLTYRAKRTTKRALTLIGLAWSISFILWAPAILFWQYFVGERTVAPHECYIQFISEPITTFCTAIAAFYLPVSIMSVLYWRIYRETEQRSRELAGLKASGNQGDPEESVNPQTGSSRSHGSYEIQPDAGKNTQRFRFWSRKSGGDPDHSSYEIQTNAEKTAAGERSSGKTAGHFRFWSRNSGGDPDHSSYEIRKDARKSAGGCFRFWSRTSGGNPDPSSCEIQANAGKTVAGERSSGKTVGRFRFWNRNTGNPDNSSYEIQKAAGKTATRRFRFWKSGGIPDSSDSWNNNKMSVSIEHSEDEGEEAPHVYSIVLERRDDSQKFQPADAEPRPSRKGDSKPSRPEALGNPEESVIPKTGSSRIHSSYEIQSAGKTAADQRSAGKTVGRFRFWSRNSGGDPDRSSNDSWNNNETAVSIDQSEDEGEEALHITSVAPENRNAEPRVSGKGVSQPPSPDAKEPATQKKTEVSKRKKPSLVKEKKAAQTLSAILLAFILTWTPYNIMVLVNAFCRPDCIPEALWALGYWLCYVNSTVNPMCYALCNKAFRTTFRAILLCEWSQIQPRPAHAQRHR